MSDQKKEPPRRMRWSVPAADVSTNRWLDAQDDVSASLKELIRESIRRDGYIDAANAPVEQLPRRGRPPLERQLMDDDPGDARPSDGDSPTVQTIHEVIEQDPDVEPQPVISEPLAPEPFAPRVEPQPQSSVPQGLEAFLTS